MKRDSYTADLFEVPVPVPPLAGALAVGPALCALLSRLLKETPLSRHDVAARMSELTGETITKHQIDAWCSESRNGWRFPLEYAPAFEVALETHSLGAWYANLRGGKLLVGKEAVDAEIGKLERMREDAARRIRALKGIMGEQS